MKVKKMTNMNLKRNMKRKTNRLSGSDMMFGISRVVTIFCIFVGWINHLN